MKKEDVPQDVGISEGMKEVTYAVDENGGYELIASAGWEPKNIANYQAWDIIAEQIEETRKKIRAGKLSLLAYHMVKNQMDTGLLAKYVGMFRWRVKLHLKPMIFKNLKRPVLQKYADLFGITVEQLTDPATLNEKYTPGKDRLI